MMAFFEIIGHIGRFYKYSGKRTAALKAHQQALNQPILKIMVNAFTRWLSHNKVTRTLWVGLLAVLNHLYNTMGSDVNSLSCYTLMCDYRFVATLLLMRDVLPKMATMAKLLQKRPPPFKLLMEMVPQTTTDIENMIGKPGTEYQKLDNALKALQGQCKA